MTKFYNIIGEDSIVSDQYTVSFNAGKTSATFSVQIHNETFNCTIKADSIPSGVIGNFDPITVIVLKSVGK